MPRAPLAGKSLARRQLDFALAAGCERVIALGDGASPEAIALRHAAEARGARFQAIGDTHGLLGAVRGGGRAAGARARAAARRRAARSKRSSGAARCWCSRPGRASPRGSSGSTSSAPGPGRWSLPGRWSSAWPTCRPTARPTAALLRIALQARVAEKRLPEQALAEGSWAIARRRRRRRRCGSRPGSSATCRRRGGSAPSRLLARFGLEPLAIPLLALPRALAGAVGAASRWRSPARSAPPRTDWPALGFALVALGALLAEFAAGLGRLRDAPFAAPAQAPAWPASCRAWSMRR